MIFPNVKASAAGPQASDIHLCQIKRCHGIFYPTDATHYSSAPWAGK
jgi:hypothetical protein